MIILDTDCLSLLDRQRQLESSKLRENLNRFEPNNIYATIISFEEHMRGWLSFIARCKNSNEEIFAYERLHRFLESYRESQVLDFEEEVVKVFDKLKKSTRRIGTMDLKIAAIAIANDAILISRNLVDFERVPGLTVENWT